MAIAFDAVTGGNRNPIAGNNLSFSHTCTGSDRFLLVFVADNMSGNVTGITYNGVTMTDISSGYNVNGAVDLTVYGLIAPATGANTVSINFAASSSWGAAVAHSYTGVDQSTFPTIFTNNKVTSTSITTSATTTVDDSWLVSSARGSSSGATSASTGATTRFSTAGFIQTYDSGGATGGAGSKSMRITGSNQVLGMQLVVLAPDTGGGGGGAQNSNFLKFM